MRVLYGIGSVADQPCMPYPFDLLAATVDVGLRSGEIRLARAAGAEWIASVARRRLQALVAFARTRSPFYREHYRALPADAPLAALPSVRRRDLMARFDDWATDRRVCRADIERFLAERGASGGAYLDRYTVWTSSGTTGEPGIFVQNEEAMSIYDALVATQVDARTFGPREMARWSRAQGGSALVVATGGAYPAIAAWQRLARINPALRGHVYSITMPLSQLVATLNASAPTFLSTYPTMGVLLAAERNARRLAIAPAAVWCGGECLSQRAREAIEQAFDCRVHEEYGAAECFAIAGSCPLGAMHYHADWVLLEPIDADGQPVPPGADSHSVLITNLANRLQPIIRYDLGDSIRVVPEGCACGSPLPVIEVRGRSDDVLVLRAASGARVPILPLALETVVESVLGPAPFQILLAGASTLRVRLARNGDHASGSRARTACLAALHEYLAAQGLANVRVIDDAAPPALDPRTGKLRRVIAEPQP